MKVLVAVAPSGNLCTVIPLYTRNWESPLEVWDNYVVVAIQDDPPLGYAVDFGLDNVHLFNKTILNHLEILGEL
jgi:hypothetical protein